MSIRKNKETNKRKQSEWNQHYRAQVQCNIEMGISMYDMLFHKHSTFHVHIVAPLPDGVGQSQTTLDISLRSNTADLPSNIDFQLYQNKYINFTFDEAVDILFVKLFVRPLSKYKSQFPDPKDIVRRMMVKIDGEGFIPEQKLDPYDPRYIDNLFKGLLWELVNRHLNNPDDKKRLLTHLKRQWKSKWNWIDVH